MPADQPEGPRRSPLDDLRERLARLPPGHPSAPKDRPPAGPEPPGQGREAPGPGEPPGPAEPPPIPSATRRSERPGLLDQAARLERLSRALWPGARAGTPGQQESGAADAPGGASPLTGPERRAAYQPWFADADRPWFSPDRGGRSG